MHTHFHRECIDVSIEHTNGRVCITGTRQVFLRELDIVFYLLDLVPFPSYNYIIATELFPKVLYVLITNILHSLW